VSRMTVPAFREPEMVPAILDLPERRGK
jgi:hypothetical protein